MFQRIRYQDINKIYSSSAEQRYQQLLSKFQAVYNCKAQFIVRAPGRVNIIGQHIDYEGYGVLPAAVQRDFVIAVQVCESQQINVKHMEPQKYPQQTFTSDPQIEIKFQHSYLKYIRGGYKAGVQGLEKLKLKGMNLLISGNIPIAAGLSSSSAFCVSIALASLTANKGQNTINNINLFIQRIINHERLLGTACGGMDQTISILGQQNKCFYITFNPIVGKQVSLPNNCKFVIMDSLVESAKLNTVFYRYNKRVCECRIAVKLLSRKLGIVQNMKTLKQVQDFCKLPLEQMSKIVDYYIDKHDYTQLQLQNILQVSLKQQLSDIQLSQGVLSANKYFRPFEAAKHVFEQANRVIKYIQICQSPLKNINKLQILGKLMNQSQYSCSQVYDCSCQQLNQLTNLAVRYGALGSRLTGAGWGGCTVSLVQSQKLQEFIQKMLQSYYSSPQRKQKISQKGVQNVIFQSIPAMGACIIQI